MVRDKVATDKSICIDFLPATISSTHRTQALSYIRAQVRTN